MAEVAVAREAPDMDKRNTMNLLLAGGVALPAVGMAGPFLAFFMPKSAEGGGGAQPAKDAQGVEVKLTAWLAGHKAGDRSLTQGLRGDPTYLIVTENAIASYGINSICTHLGCVVPWVAAENKFKCPCHGSQYNSEGKVTKGPAPLSLAIAHTEINEADVVLLKPWTETDFRTGEAPWWK